jgi:hypothetical protein
VEDPEGIEPSSSCLRDSGSSIELRIRGHTIAGRTPVDGERADIHSDLEGTRRPSCGALTERAAITPSSPGSMSEPGCEDPETPKAASVSRAAFACVVERRMRLPPQAMASRFAGLLWMSVPKRREAL